MSLPKTILIICLASVAGFAQASKRSPRSPRAGQTVTLTWVDSQNPGGTTYNVYRGAMTGSSCGPDTSGYTKLNAAAIATKTYTDTTAGAGTYCYSVRAVCCGSESVDSNLVSATVKPYAVTLSVTVP